MIPIPAGDPFDCPGCHSGDFAGFDHFCDVLNVKDDEVGQAFAAWLGNRYEWDGEYQPVTKEA